MARTEEQCNRRSVACGTGTGPSGSYKVSEWPVPAPRQWLISLKGKDKKPRMSTKVPEEQSEVYCTETGSPEATDTDMVDCDWGNPLGQGYLGHWNVITELLERRRSGVDRNCRGKSWLHLSRLKVMNTKKNTKLGQFDSCATWNG